MYETISLRPTLCGKRREEEDHIINQYGKILYGKRLTSLSGSVFFGDCKEYIEKYIPITFIIQRLLDHKHVHTSLIDRIKIGAQLM